MTMTIINYLSKIFLAQPFYFTIVFLGLIFFICVFFKGWPSLPISSFYTDIDDEDNEDDDDGDEGEEENTSYNISIKDFKFRIEDKTYEISTDFKVIYKKNS